MDKKPLTTGCLPLSLLLPRLAAQLDLFAHRFPGFLGEEGVPPALHHALKHLVRHREGNLVGFEELAVRGVPAAQDRLELAPLHTACIPRPG